MDKITIKGIELTTLKRIKHPLGDIFHGLKSDNAAFKGFGEAYFSSIKDNAIKAWKRHKRMTLNLVVPVGKVKFVFYDDRNDSETKGTFNEYILSPDDNYCRLTVSPNIWFGFKGMDSTDSLVLNIADIPHDPEEVNRAEIIDIEYNW